MVLKGKMSGGGGARGNVRNPMIGPPGMSAYEVWLSSGNEGSVEDFLESLEGEPGLPGYTPQKGIDYFDGTSGVDGYTPRKGIDYFDGAEGKSAYEIWLAAGNEGSEEDFIISLRGEQGDPGSPGVDGQTPQKGVDYFDGADGKDGESAYEIWLALGNSGSETDFINSLKGRDGKDADESEIALLKQQVADLMYEPITLSFTNNIGTVEKGTVITEVKLSWKTNKTPTALILDGGSVDVLQTEKVLTGLAVSADRTFKLKAVDEREAVAEADTKITFLNGVYYGVVPSNAEINNSLVLSLTKKLQSDKGLTFTETAGEGQKIAYALPEAYGEPVFKVNNFEGGFYLASTFEFTNSTGKHTENYCVWLSENTGLGTTTVEVS